MYVSLPQQSVHLFVLTKIACFIPRIPIHSTFPACPSSQLIVSCQFCPHVSILPFDRRLCISPAMAEPYYVTLGRKRGETVFILIRHGIQDVLGQCSWQRDLGCTVWGSNLCRGRKFFSSVKCANCLWVPPTILFNGYWDSFWG